MAQAVAAVVAGAVKLGAAIATAYKAHAIVRALITVAALVASSAIARASAKTSGGKIDQGTEVKFKVDPSMPRQIAVGDTATGGSWVFAFTWTDDPKIPNKYLVRVIALSDFPILGVDRIMEGNNVLTWDGDFHLTDAACTNAHLTANGEPALYVRVNRGHFGALADADLVIRSGGVWTNNHKGIGIAYAVVRSRYDGDAFPQGEPALTFALKGARIYDDRLDGSKPGRTGAQRLATPSTWEYSPNTANIVAQVLRGFYINGQLILGAQAEERDLDDGMLVAAYNTCDQLVDQNTGPQVKRYMAGMMLSSSETVQSMLEDLSMAMDGTIWDRGGQITIFPGGTRTPVMDLTEEDIVWTDEKSWQPKADLDNLYNNLEGSYVSDVDGFQEKPLPPLIDTDWEALDGGERLTRTISLRAVTTATQAQRTATRIWKASRWQGTVSFVGPLACIEMEQGDWFTLTSPRWNMTTKYFEVVTSEITEVFKVSVIAKEVHPDIDGWVPADEEIPDSSDYYSSPGNFLIVPELVVSSVTIQNADSSLQLPGIRVEVLNMVEQGPASGVDYEFGYYIGITLTNQHRLGLRAASEHVFVITEGILPGYTYAVRARSTDGVRYSPWSTWYTSAAPNVYQVPTVYAFGGKTPQEWIDLIALAGGAETELGQTILAMQLQLDLTAHGVANNFFNLVQDKARFEKLTHMEDYSEVGTALQTETEVRSNADEQFQSIFTALGAWNTGNTAYILNGATVWVTPTQSLANKFDAITASFGDASGAISAEATVRANADGVFAQNFAFMGARNLSGTAFIFDLDSVQVSNTGETFAERINSLQVDTDGITADISQLFQITAAHGAKYALRLDVNNHITGFTALNDGQQGGFAFVADYFGIVTPDGLKTPFVVFNGEVHIPDAYVHNLAAGSVSAVSIQAGIITADKIVGHAITDVNTSGTNVGSASIGSSPTVYHTHTYVSTGGEHTIFIDALVGQSGTGVSGVVATVINRETGITLGQGAVVFPGAFQLDIVNMFFDQPGPGTWHYDVYLNRTPGSGASNYGNTITTYLTELKR